MQKQNDTSGPLIGGRLKHINGAVPEGQFLPALQQILGGFWSVRRIGAWKEASEAVKHGTGFLSNRELY
jgi:hypothetical protein